MTNYVAHVALGPAVSSMVAKDKGDVSNRANCAKEQLGNNIKTLAADTVVLSSVGGAAVLADKNANKLEKLFDNIVNKFNLKRKPPRSRAEKTIDGFSKTVNKSKLIKKPTFKSRMRDNIINLVEKCKTPKAKAAALFATFVALPAMGLISYINHRHSYREGQIDQKYTDKAKLEKQGRNLI